MTTASALRGCRVVVTRPEEQAEALAEPLRRRGAVVRVRPLVRIAPAADGGAALSLALGRLEQYDWVVFTSTNAVHSALRVAPAGRRWPRVGCVGEATARVAREYGLTVPLIPESFTGEALAQALSAVARLEGAEILWPRASGAGRGLLDGLLAAGASVDAPEAYRTEPDLVRAEALRAELLTEPAHLVAFTSPSGVQAFGSDYPGAVAVIGAVTGRAARAAALDVQVQPAKHTVEALVEGIESWWFARDLES